MTKVCPGRMTARASSFRLWAKKSLMESIQSGPLIGYLEDDPIIRENVAQLLMQGGFRVLACATLGAANQAFSESAIDLAILDVEIEGDRLGGMTLCQQLRQQRPDLPVIFFTSHAQVEMQSRGWLAGADDYVSKETELSLVILRIRALLARYRRLRDCFREGRSLALHEDEFGVLSLSVETFQVHWKGQPVELSLTQFWLLKAIVDAGGTAVGHEALQKAASIVVEPNTIVAHIKTIRDAFKRVDPTFAAIRTERGRGYRWAAESG